ncbi:hypothetical protein FRC04_009910 [Tulasnella sp. 424]|nr:hypothetical protein FRC04_009910 [Tulasnella sp. 424]
MSSSDTIIEVKDGKLALKQKALRWEDSTTALRELLAFADFLSVSSTPNPLTTFPSEHLPLLGKLVIESDKTGPTLAKNVKKTIMKKCGAQDDKNALDDPRLPVSTLATAISDIATRVNYGIQDTPAPLTIWRWELNNPDSLLPASSVDSACNAAAASERRKEREEAKSQFKAHYDGLDEEQKKSLLEKQKKNATSKDASSSTAQPSNGKAKKETAKALPTKESNTEVKKTKEVADQPPKKPNKQAQMMQSFFKSSNKATAVDKASKGPSSSDFDKTFKAFLIKKDIHLAPVNLFLARAEITSKGKGKEKADVIVLDDDGDIEMSVNSPTKPSLAPQRPIVASLPNAATATAQDLLDNFLSSLPSPSLPRGRRRTKYAVQRTPSKPNDSEPKSSSRLNVRTVVAKLTTAEVTDDIKTVRDCEKLLRDRRKIPIKYLQFCDNLRPGNRSGTWTKSSAFVGPRTPFTKDPVAFDYSYDSGEEWEEEPDDAEEVLSSVGSEEEDAGSGEEELDDWLVGDDEVEYEPGAILDPPSRSLSPPLPNGGKRKLEVEKEKEKDKDTKKRRIVKTLVPFSTGPHWENSVGDCQDHLRNYRIQLLNDTPYPIDPFTFISEDITGSVQDGEMATRHAVGALKSGKPITQDGFVIPALPPHLHPSSQINLPTQTPTADGQPAKAPGNTKSKPAKKPFPPQHLPQLLNLINGSTLTKLHLVEQLGQEFKAIKEVKKYAIDAALGELAVKSAGVWTVKDEAWRRCGLAPPAAKL